MDELIAKNIRKYKKVIYNEDIGIEKIQYASGLIDTDGCFLASDENDLRIFIGQAENGIDCLHFMYDNFGGIIKLHKKGNENHQTSYTWLLLGKDAQDFSKLIYQYLLIKKRESKLFNEFPLDNTHFVSVIAKNIKTNEEKTFINSRECSNYIGKNRILFEKDINLIIFNDWEIRKLLSKEYIENIKQKRKSINAQIKKYKTEPHDEIPEDIIPSSAYIGGLCDGEICIMCEGKYTIHHSISQKYNPILKLMKRIYGGTISYRKFNNSWTWEIYTFAREFLENLSPYIVGKKKQVDLILNMKPGEAQKVHVELRTLKGKCTALTPVIDAINAGNVQVFTEAKKFPMGVFKNGDRDRLKAQIQYNKKVYVLGWFALDQVEKAHELYLKFKKNIALEKRGGPKVNFDGLSFTDRNTNSL